VTDPKRLAGLLRILDGYEGSPIVRCALPLAPLVFVRPGELRKAEWSEIDLDPVPLALRDVPIDDEPETEDERAAVAEARREIEEGKGILHDEAMRRLGLA
jgi:hypothetical protein